MAGELLEFEDGTIGIALNLEEDNVVPMGKAEIQEGGRLPPLGELPKCRWRCHVGLVNALGLHLTEETSNHGKLFG